MIRMYQSAFPIQIANQPYTVHVKLSGFRVSYCAIFQQRSRPSIAANEIHHKHVATEDKRFRTQDASGMNANEIPHLLLRPCFHHFARVASAVAVPKSEFPTHVFIPVFECQDWCFVHLNCPVFVIRTGGVVHVSLLPSTDTTVDAFYEASIE